MLYNLSKRKDPELLELLKNGSHSAFGELYARYYDPLIYYCKQFMNDEEGAEDVVQDIFMQLWERRGVLQVTSSFSGYLYASAKNNILNLYRQFDVHSRFAQYILIHETELTNETEDSIIENDYNALLNNLIDQLPPMQKEVFRLSRIEGMTSKEIAESLQITDENVRKHTSLAMKKIKNLLLKQKDIHFQIIIAFLIIFF